LNQLNGGRKPPNSKLYTGNKPKKKPIRPAGGIIDKLGKINNLRAIKSGGKRERGRGKNSFLEQKKKTNREKIGST